MEAVTIEKAKKAHKRDTKMDEDLLEQITRSLEDIKHGRIKEWKSKN